MESKRTRNSMSKLQRAKKQFEQDLLLKHNSDMDNIRRGWRCRMEEFERQKTSVDLGYESLQTRLETIATSLEIKTVKIREECLRLKENIDNLSRSISKAKAATEMRGIDESAEVQIELRLQMQAGQLKQRLQRSRAAVDDVIEHRDKYKAMYLKNLSKQKRIQSKRESKVRIAEIVADRKQALDLFKAAVQEEQQRLTADIETLRRMREELLHPPEPPKKKKSPQELYYEMLREAGQYVDDEERVAVTGCSANDPIMFEDDSDEAVPEREPPQPEFDYEQLSYLENGIQALMATGNYSENDQLIVDMRNKIKALYQ